NDRKGHLQRIDAGVDRGNQIVFSNTDDVQPAGSVFLVKALQDRSIMLPIGAPWRKINDHYQLFVFCEFAKVNISTGFHVRIGPSSVLNILFDERRLLVLAERKADAQKQNRDGKD